MAISERDFGALETEVKNLKKEVDEKIRKHIETLYEKDRVMGLQLNTLKIKSGLIGLGGGAGGTGIIYYILENLM